MKQSASQESMSFKNEKRLEHYAKHQHYDRRRRRLKKSLQNIRDIPVRDRFFSERYIYDVVQ